MKIDFSNVKDSPVLNPKLYPHRFPRSFYAMMQQTHYWRGQDGWYSVSQMELRHRKNVVMFMLARAQEMQWSYIFTMPNPYLIFQGDHAIESLERILHEETEEVMAMEPKKWMRSTILFRRMNLGIRL